MQYEPLKIYRDGQLSRWETYKISYFAVWIDRDGAYR